MISRVVFVGLAACATAIPPANSADGGTNADAVLDAARVSNTHDAAPTSGCSFTGELASWQLTGQSGSETSVAATTMASGVTAGALTRTAALTGTAGSGSINGSNWPTASALDATKYYSFSIEPPTGCSIVLSSISIDAKASTTGPATAVIGTSADNYATTTPVSTSAPSSPSVSVTSAGSLELRVFGYSATASSGTLRVQNTLTVTGQIM